MKQWENIRYSTGEQYFSLTQTIYYLLVIVPLGAFSLFYLEARKDEFTPYLEDSLHNMAMVGLPLGALVVLALGFVLYFRIRKVARTYPTLRLQLNGLFRANLWKYIGLTLATLFITLGMYYTHQEVMGAWAGVLIMFWSLNVPTRQRFGRELKLSRPEREIMVYGKEIEA